MLKKLTLLLTTATLVGCFGLGVPALAEDPPANPPEGQGAEQQDQGGTQENGGSEQGDEGSQQEGEGTEEEDQGTGAEEEDQGSGTEEEDQGSEETEGNELQIGRVRANCPMTLEGEPEIAILDGVKANCAARLPTAYESYLDCLRRHRIPPMSWFREEMADMDTEEVNQFLDYYEALLNAREAICREESGYGNP